MHQHRQGVHAHVARDADGRKMIELLKRDELSNNLLSYIHRPSHNTNSESIKLNVPAGFAEKDTNDTGVATAVSVVYVTMSPSFSGSVVDYVTATSTASSSSVTEASVASIAPAAVTTATTSSAQVIVASSAQTSQTSSANANAVTSSSTTAVILSASSTAPASSIGTTIAATYASAVATASPISNASSQQDVSVSSSQQDSGMTSGAKAGLAIGIILAIALAVGLVFFCWKRAKKDNSHEELNEKSGMSEKRSSFGAVAAGKRKSADSDKSFGTIHNTATAPRLSLRPVTQFLPTFGEKRKSGNPLGAAPQMSEKNSAWERRPQNGENPFNDATEKQANPFEEGDGKSIHSVVNGSEPPTPKSAQFGTAAAVAVAGKEASSPAQRGQNNVHRVQLDFKPSMDDELELKSGQLVRMLHEYDDGWALCVRMDRSQQGVAPRTCLSKTPVKPRGPPPPGGRVSPQNNMMQQAGARPLSPQQQSPNVARKPVPGQAI